ncbi:MAG: hypothetical protein ACI3XA_06825 [Clostridia bacterium]
MSREREGYREMLMYLAERYPMTMTKKQAREALGVSFTHLQKMIENKHIVVVDGKIPIGSVAKYLCG